MNNANTNCQEFLDKEVTIYYGEDKEVQGVIINSTPDLGITMQFSKIKDSDVLSYSDFNNKIFIPFDSINDFKSGLCMVEDNGVLEQSMYIEDFEKNNDYTDKS